MSCGGLHALRFAVAHTVMKKEGCGHHPNGFEDPTPIVDFIIKNS